MTAHTTYCTCIGVGYPHGLDELPEHLDLPLLLRERVPHVRHLL